MNTTNIIVLVLAVAMVWMVIGGMRSRRKAWEEHERKRKELAEALRESNALAGQITTNIISTIQSAKVKAVAGEHAAIAAKLAAEQGARLSRQQFDFLAASSQIRYNPMKDQYEDRYGNVVPEPNKFGLDRAKGPDRTSFYAPDAFGARIMDPRQVGARISTVDMGCESEQEALSRRAVESAMASAMADAINTGMGIVQISSSRVEHIPPEKYQDWGGTDLS